MKTVQFEEATYIDFVNWASENKIIFKKIADLIKDIDRNGVNIGIGKPEPLKHDLAGYWSRRITDEHRLVYKIENEIIVIAQCKGHYK
jgi:toxin YoeB